MNKENPTQHRMTRRAAAHDYTRPGIYHITMHVADCLGQPLGAVVGDLNAPDGSANAPRVALSAAGKMVEHELLTAITSRYPMIIIQDYVIMPEHLHFIAVVQKPIISQNGKHQPLGQIIAGFKKGCNKHYWEITGQAQNTIIDGQIASHTAPSGLPAGYKVPSWGTTGRQPLFEGGYCDVMPVDERQLATQRAYIAGNPRSRLLRTSHREWLTPRRTGFITALTPSALRGYLQRECPPSLVTGDALAAIENRLLLANGFIACDIYGDSSLLTEHRCLPVVCHRKHAKRFAEQQSRCLDEANRGAVLISACIAPREREIINECVNHGFPVITLHDNGFADRYHPSADRLDLCAADRLLIITPWQYQYRPKDKDITVPECKTMNCVAQAICRTRDDWWIK